MTDEAHFSSGPPPLAGYRIRLAARRVRRGAGRARGFHKASTSGSPAHIGCSITSCVFALCAYQSFIE